MLLALFAFLYLFELAVVPLGKVDFIVVSDNRHWFELVSLGGRRNLGRRVILEPHRQLTWLLRLEASAESTSLLVLLAVVQEQVEAALLAESLLLLPVFIVLVRIVLLVFVLVLRGVLLPWGWGVLLVVTEREVEALLDTTS